MSFGGGFGGGYSTGGYGSAGGRAPNTTALRNEDFKNLIAFEKNFYVEHPAVTSR